MTCFQVVAVYPSGRRYVVREFDTPHESYLSAAAHRAACERSADPADTWIYEVDMTYTGSDGQRHWRGNVDPVADLGYSLEELPA